MVRFRGILKRFAEQQIDFVVIGGVAAAMHGSPVGTEDLDLCVAFDQTSLPKLLAALRPINPRLRHRPDRMPLPDDPARLQNLQNLYLVTDLGPLDLLGELPGVCAFDALADKTITMDLGDFRCRVLNLDTLIRAKKVAGRAKDKINVYHLEAIRRLRDEDQGRYPDQ